jgi:hypothetical protein
MLIIEEAQTTLLELRSFAGGAVETQYKGHIIRVSAVRIPQIDRWTVRSYVSWEFANNSGEKTLVHADLHFGCVEEAMRAGVEFAIAWIEMISFMI